MNSTFPFSAHSDVLEAPIPDTIEGIHKLLDEIKSRGRSVVQAGIWPEASALYRRAIEISKSDTFVTAATPELQQQQQQLAVLYANLSLTDGKMNLWETAKDVALLATKSDPEYVKGWWRLGQAQAALKYYKEAIVSLEKGVSLEPDNKALQKELLKMKDCASKAKKDDTTAKKDVVTSSEKPNTTMKTKLSTGTSQSTTKKSEDTTTTTTDDVMEVDLEGTTFTQSEHIKGYKIVNGKKTSFFHNELSEEAKQLIGDIAPKKLDPSNTTSATGLSSTAASLGTDGTNTTTTSAWNQAGTWEEKNVTTWASSTLESNLLQCQYILPVSSPAPNAIVTVTKVIITNGNASVASVRGKKRYMYEYSITVHWKFQHDTVSAEGTLEFPDIDGTCSLGDGYDASHYIVTTTTDDSVRPVLDSFVHKQGLRNVLHDTIDDWVRTFQKTY